MSHVTATPAQGIHPNQRPQPPSNAQSLVQNGVNTHVQNIVTTNGGQQNQNMFLQLNMPPYLRPEPNPTLFLAQNASISSHHGPNGGVVVDVQQNPQSGGYSSMQYNHFSYYPSHTPMQHFQNHNVMPPDNYYMQPQSMQQQYYTTMTQPAVQSKPKKILRIADPKTLISINQDQLQENSTTVVEPVKPHSDVGSRFAQQVANLALKNENDDASVTTQNDNSESLAAPRTSPIFSHPPPPSQKEPALVTVQSVPKNDVQEPIEDPKPIATPVIQIPSPAVVPEVDESDSELVIVDEQESDKPVESLSPAPLLEEETLVSNRPETPDKDNSIETVDEKLMKLEEQLIKLRERDGEAIEKNTYSFEFLYLIREIVKISDAYPCPCSQADLKVKMLDQESMPVQSQNRPKYSGAAGFFNPQWAPSSSSSNIVGSKRPVYQGRHSDNHNRARKKGQSITQRASMDRTIRQPLPVPDTLRKAENAWRPKRKDNVEANEDDKIYDKSRKEIRSIFNKITPSTFQELAAEFFNLNVDKDEKLQRIAIDLIFDKAVEEPKFCSLYTQICKQQVDKGDKGQGSFFRALIQKCQSTFEGSSTIGENIKEAKDLLESETVDKKRTELQERIELLEAKEKRCLLGNIKFISHLYAANLLSEVVISCCICKLQNMYTETSDDMYVQYGIELMELVASSYFAKDAAMRKQGHDNVETFIKWLPQIRNEVSTKARVMIMNFEDFCQAGYKPKNADKGPKTIAQIHEDAKKEEEKKKNERIAYDYKQKERPQRTPYTGSSSLENKVDKRDKRINAATASNNAASGSRRPNQSLKSAMASGSKLGGNRQSFYQRAEPTATSETAGDGWSIVNRGGGGGGGSGTVSRLSSQERKSSEAPVVAGSGASSRAGSETPSKNDNWRSTTLVEK